MYYFDSQTGCLFKLICIKVSISADNRQFASPFSAQNTAYILFANIVVHSVRLFCKHSLKRKQNKTFLSHKHTCTRTTWSYDAFDATTTSSQPTLFAGEERWKHARPAHLTGCRKSKLINRTNNSFEWTAVSVLFTPLKQSGNWMEEQWKNVVMKHAAVLSRLMQWFDSWLLFIWLGDSLAFCAILSFSELVMLNQFF